MSGTWLVQFKEAAACPAGKRTATLAGVTLPLLEGVVPGWPAGAAPRGGRSPQPPCLPTVGAGR